MYIEREKDKEHKILVKEQIIIQVTDILKRYFYCILDTTYYCVFVVVFVVDS